MRPLTKVPTAATALLLAVALIGLLDASYLTIEHYRDVIPPCAVGSCETVLTSAYSTVFGVPVSLLGALYYLLIAGCAFACLEGKHGSGGTHEPFLRAAIFLSPLGLLASAALVSIMAFALHDYCLYCLGSAGTSTLIFAIAAWIWARYRPRGPALPAAGAPLA
ncbi:MAG: vitamin K epoxide reductase family protein [Patescibacteria group bacterium]|nr:vitamin K epoxide reductase family protein [Patescibacteria group bacterium]